jgi:methylmalonyl-CoA mutase N-terminal domain/subunit
MSTVHPRHAKWLKDDFPKSKPRQAEFKTSSGLDLEPLYLPAEPDAAYVEKLGWPGEYPYTRGVQASMYRSRLWTMRQYAGYATAEESNARYHFLLSQGSKGLSVAFDLPTQTGYDADDPMALGEVGKVGVSICSIHDMARLFEGIPLGEVSTSMTINAPAAILLALYIAVGEQQGVPQDQLRGTIQNDILKEYIARGTYIYPPAPSMRLITDVFAYCGQHVPQWNTISISGYHLREAGCTAAQEIAFTLGNGLQYVQAAVEVGLDPNQFGENLSFFFNAHNHFLEEVAKFRAARRLWAKLMRERFGVTNPAALKLRFHTQTGGSTLTAQQPENNIVRVTVQALSAIFGGTQSLHTNSMDEALALPTEKAAQIALRTQQILAYESGVADTIDPLAGSYAIEALTDSLEAQAQSYLAKIDALGGALKAIEVGYIQNEINDAAYAYQLAVQNKRQIVVGVNEYVSEERPEDKIAILKVDPAIEAGQCQKLAALRARRDGEKASAHIAAIESAARGRDNLLPLFIQAVKAEVTLGEICHALRRVWGEYRPEALV